VQIAANDRPQLADDPAMVGSSVRLDVLADQSPPRPGVNNCSPGMVAKRPSHAARAARCAVEQRLLCRCVGHLVPLRQ
jgi:hypothetical protein